MSDEIPADIKTEAASLAHDFRRGFFDLDGFEAVIGFALLSERERCAKIAERDGSTHDATLSQQTAEWHARVNAEVRAADRIARSIRNPTPEAS